MPGQDPQYGDYGDQSTSTVDTAKSEAANVKDTAAGAASDVAQTAKSEASNVAQEAKYQARNLMDQTRSEVRGQVNSQQSALAGKLNDWASELGSMASKSDESGTMTDLAQEASRRVGEISHWLDNHEPRDVLEEVKRFARRQPVAFLAIAAAAGVVAGQLEAAVRLTPVSILAANQPRHARMTAISTAETTRAPDTATAPTKMAAIRPVTARACRPGLPTRAQAQRLPSRLARLVPPTRT